MDVLSSQEGDSLRHGPRRYHQVHEGGTKNVDFIVTFFDESDGRHSWRRPS